jgi:hypothetical protein
VHRVSRVSRVIIGSVVLTSALTAAPAHAAGSPQQTRITANLSTTKISIGQHATVSGLLEADGPSGWQPLANQPVDLYLSGTGTGPGSARVTTDEHGDYAYPINAGPGSIGKALIVTAFNEADNPDPGYSGTSSAALTLQVPVTRSPNSGEIMSDTYGGVTLAGTFYPELKKGASVSIQYSSNGTDHWKQLALAHADSNGYFRGTAHYSQSGFWRARYAGDADDYPAIMDQYKNWRWNTHFTRFKATRSGSKVKVAGTLVRYFSATKQGGFAHHTVLIIFRFKGKKTWYNIGSAKTNANGQFSAKVKHYGAGYYLALFQGSDTTWASESPTPLYVLRVPAATATSLNALILPGLPQPARLIRRVY